MGELSWTRAIVLGLIPGGQLYYRLFNIGGSMDKWWLLFLAFIPPFSLIPMILIKLGVISIKEGTGFINPLNWWLLIPIFTIIIMPLLLDNVFNLDSDSLIGFLITFIFIIGACSITNIINMRDKCKPTTFNNIGKSVIDAISAYGMATFIKWCINFIPVVGEVLMEMESIPFIGSIIKQTVWILGYIVGLFLLMSFNQATTSICNVEWHGTKFDKFLVFSSFGVILLDYML
jgi:hypothetical protein